MTRLQFGADGRLRDERRVLAFITAEERVDAVGLLVADDVEQVIVAPVESGNPRLDLLDNDGRRTGGFQPFRLRRGGRLRSGELAITLQGHSWSNDRWSFAMLDGHRVEATIEHPRSGRRNGLADVEIALDVDAPAHVQPRSAQALLLAFGCWLIARWHAVAPDDHMLTSTDAGGEFAGSLGPAARGGIAQREAN